MPETGKHCKKCNQKLGESSEEVTIKALTHWINEHDGSDELVDILSNVWVRIDCESCGQQFVSPVNHGPGRLGAAAHCSECVEEDRYRSLYAKEMSPGAVVACQADPCEDDA